MLFGFPKSICTKDGLPEGVMPAADEKARFTTFVFGSACGLNPTFSIVKCQARSGYDLSHTKVIHNLHNESFTAADG